MSIKSGFKEKSKCCGCGACVNICPQRCVTLREDSNHHINAYYDFAACIDCNRCLEVCPIENPNLHYNSQSYWYLSSHSKETLDKSSSGGAFTEILLSCLEANDCVYGAAYDSNFHVKHVACNIDDFSSLRKSKFVQSEIVDIFNQIKDLLTKTNNKVVFTGTPCQVSAMNNYLKMGGGGVNTSNLITIDLICHGVPSYWMLRRYLDYVKKCYRRNIIGLEFRHKVSDGTIENSRNVEIVFDDGEVLIENSNENPYLIAYYNGIMYRDSCYECPFKQSKRCGDITIGDFWHIEQWLPNVNKNIGKSVVFANTEKGKKIIKKIKMWKCCEIFSVEETYALSTNRSLRGVEHFDISKRDIFFDAVSSRDFGRAVKKVFPKYFFPLKQVIYVVRHILK